MASPIAAFDFYTIEEGGTLTVSIADGLLRNDGDPDGDPIFATSIDTTGLQGSANVSTNGSFTFTPSAGFSGLTSFLYTISDGQGGTATARAYINVIDNLPPLARDDVYTTRQGQQLMIAAAQGVLQNDSDPEGRSLSVSSIGATQTQGDVTLFTDGNFVFTPSAGFKGVTSFTYTVTDDRGQSETATVVIVVEPNLPPIAERDAYAAVAGQQLVVAVADGVLANDRDPEADSLTVFSIDLTGAQGSVTASADGSFQFMASAGFSGTTSFTYTMRDSAGGSASQTVDIYVAPAPQPSGAGNDAIVGGAGDEIYLGFGGSDVISGEGGADTLFGGAAGDLLQGREGLDSLFGEAGADTLDGGAGVDTLTGGLDDDTYINPLGDLIVEYVNGGTDTVESNLTFSLAALAQVERLTLTGTGNLNASGNAAANLLTGNSGNNILNGSTGSDTMIGGTGNDIYYVDAGGDVTTEAFNQGTDLVSSSVSRTLSANIENLNLSGAANIDGNGNTGANRINGNAGNNVLRGYEGADTLNGGEGNDILLGGSSSDSLNPGIDAVRDIIRFSAVADSTGSQRDIVTAMDLNNEDRFDFTVVPTSIALVNTGTLSLATINANLATAVNAALAVNGAVLFDPTAGDLNVAGHAFLIVDANGDGSYTANADYVVQLANFTGTLTLDDFI
jgi:Ca2+-binding RTX toxin-like protein